MIKNTSTAVVAGWFLLTGASAVAQNSEVSLSAAGGLSGLTYPIQNGSRTLKSGFGVGGGYTHFLNSRWGIATGLELGSYHTLAKIDDDKVFSSYEVDSEANAFEYRVKTKGYREKQTLTTLNIPLLLQFQSRPKLRTQLYSQAGFKLSFPLSNRYKTSADAISAAGYYPDVNVEITDLPVHGFGTQTGWQSEGSYKHHVGYALAAEGGVKVRLSARRYLYAGAYIDYGLNNLKREEGDATLLTYHPNSQNRSAATGVFSLANNTGNVRLLSYGLKLRLAFTHGKAPKALAPPAAEPPLPAQPLSPVKTIEEPITDTVQAPVQMPVPAPSPLAFSEAEVDLLQTPISFNSIGNTKLTATAKERGHQLAVLLQQHPALQLQIEGHTCSIGSEEVNHRVALARAKAVATFLETKGIDSSRLQVVSKGSAEPLVPNTTEANRKQNRRVVLKVIKP